MDQDCPKCGLVNPASALHCDCGYDFTTGRVARSDANPHDPTNRAELGLTLAQVGLRNMRLGPLICAAGVGVTLLTWALSWVTGFYLIAWGAVVFGAARFFRGLGQYRRGRQAYNGASGSERC